MPRVGMSLRPQKIFGICDGTGPRAPYQMQNDGERPRSGNTNRIQDKIMTGKTFKTITSGALLIALLAGTASYADGHSERGGRTFDFAAVDANGDGEITQAEVEAFRAAQFASIDADGNGTVDADELAAFAAAREDERRAERAERVVERADTDGDGVLSQDELQANRRGGDMFERLDADDSGTITQEEVETAREARQERREERREERRDGERRGGDRG